MDFDELCRVVDVEMYFVEALRGEFRLMFYNLL